MSDGRAGSAAIMAWDSRKRKWRSNYGCGKENAASALKVSGNYAESTPIGMEDKNAEEAGQGKRPNKIKRRGTCADA